MQDYVINADLIVKVIILTIINMIIGMIWYAKPVFGRMWIKAIGKTEKEFDEMNKGAGKLYFASFISSIIMIFVLGELFLLLNITEVLDGIIVAFMIWLGFNLFGSISNLFFEQRSTKSYMIYAIYQLVFFIIAAIFYTTIPTII
jgi:hypothetical protein